jgi:hypothetical protein
MRAVDAEGLVVAVDRGQILGSRPIQGPRTGPGWCDDVIAEGKQRGESAAPPGSHPGPADSAVTTSRP